MLKVVIFIFVSVQMVASSFTTEISNYIAGDIIGIATSLQNSRLAFDGDAYRWPNATVPFIFDTGYPPRLQETFHRAIEHISSHTCVQFVPRTIERDFIKVVSGNDCASYLGRVWGSQQIILSERCNFGDFLHELMHTLGFLHEQCRPDRDLYVEIHPENICPESERNFRKLNKNAAITFNISYDYDSVMHYCSNCFSCNGRPTITTIPPGIPIGQRKQLSAKDILRVNAMYKCNMQYK